MEPRENAMASWRTPLERWIGVCWRWFGYCCLVAGAAWLLVLQTEAPTSRTIEARQSLTAVATLILGLGLFLAVRFSSVRLKTMALAHYPKYLRFAEWCRTRTHLLWILRAEALTIVAFSLLLHVDQSAEAIRIMADPADSLCLRFARFAVWLFFCPVLGPISESTYDSIRPP